MGANEISLDNKKEENNFVKYINSIDSFVNHKGYKLTAWNDSFHKRTINKYHKNITVFHWKELLANWNERVWDDNNTKDIYKENQKIDSAICIWSEPHEK